MRSLCSVLGSQRGGFGRERSRGRDLCASSISRANSWFWSRRGVHAVFCLSPWVCGGEGACGFTKMHYTHSSSGVFSLFKVTNPFRNQMKTMAPFRKYSHKQNLACNVYSILYLLRYNCYIYQIHKVLLGLKVKK